MIGRVNPIMVEFFAQLQIFLLQKCEKHCGVQSQKLIGSQKIGVAGAPPANLGETLRFVPFHPLPPCLLARKMLY